MNVIIHLLIDGIEDSMIIEAPTLEELRQIAQAEVDKRGAEDYWSTDLNSDS